MLRPGGRLSIFEPVNLLAHAEAAGFGELHLEYRADIRTVPADPDYDWDGFLLTSPNPLAPRTPNCSTAS